MDVTLDAQKIISCVARMKERYGVAAIVDVLRGSKNEKVLRLGLSRLSTYGISDKSGTQLRDIINHLILSGGLIKTDDQYPIIKLGPSAAEILRGSKTVNMKLSIETPVSKKEIKLSSNKAKAEKGKKSTQRFFSKKGPLTADEHYENKKAPLKIERPETKSIDRELFERLKELRLAIATEQKVPAFVILHDSSLTDMCAKLPNSIEDLTKVSGIGKVKAERYGERFLALIKKYQVSI